MRAAVYHSAGDVRVETVPDPRIEDPRDAVVRVLRATICGSDLWSWRGVTTWQPGWRTGHEFVGVVEATGTAVHTVRPGEAVIAPFVYSCGDCEFCRAGLQTSCLHGGGFGASGPGAQAELVRVPLADGTLVHMAETLRDSERGLRNAALLTDVMPTGHHAARLAGVRPGVRAIVIGDGAVGLCAVLAARRLGATVVIAVGHRPDRLALAQRFGADQIVNAHDEDVVTQLREATDGGAESVLEAVGTEASYDLAGAVARPGGTVGGVGVPHTVHSLNLKQLMFNNVALRTGVAPARAYIEELQRDVVAGTLDPSPVLDLTLPLSGVAEGFRAMDERRAIKVCLDPALTTA